MPTIDPKRHVITDPGKFEGEMDYAPYFYDRWLESDYDDQFEDEDGDLVTIWNIGDEDRKQFPHLTEDRVAFVERSDGFWIEVEVPEPPADGGDEEVEPPSADDLQTEAVLSDARGGGYNLSIEGKHIRKFGADRDEAVRYVSRWMKEHNFRPNLYYVNDHGNIDLLDNETGEVIRSWV